MTISSAREARSNATKRRLLEASVAVLVERGYGNASTVEIQQRAGVSRGALLHHYPSRIELMIAVVEHLTRERVTEFPQLSAQAPHENRTEWAVRSIWRSFQGPLYVAALELWQASRYDEELRAALLPQERVLGGMLREMAAELFGPGLNEQPNFQAAVETLYDSMRGAAARSVLRNPDSDERLIANWVRLVERLAA